MNVYLSLQSSVLGWVACPGAVKIENEWKVIVILVYHLLFI
jgi:hypothetical protein